VGTESDQSLSPGRGSASSYDIHSDGSDKSILKKKYLAKETNAGTSTISTSGSGGVKKVRKQRGKKNHSVRRATREKTRKMIGDCLISSIPKFPLQKATIQKCFQKVQGSPSGSVYERELEAQLGLDDDAIASPTG
jgi:hypothetical protein